MAGPGFAPGRPVGAEDIRDLQSFARHGAADQAGGRGPRLRCSNGLLTARRVVLATWA